MQNREGGRFMAEEKQKNQKKTGELTRSLPRNYRQIGEPGAKKIYMEDYVYTYLNKLAQPENLYARGAILFGKMYKTPIGKCIFISGAAACQNFELDLDETIFSEESWGEIYRIRDSFFPEMEICGWFLSRMGFSVDLNDKIIRIHMDNFSGENKVLYMIDALENEDAFYQFENYSLKKQRGYYIYYETNQEMKNYMLAEGEMGRMPERGRYSETIKRDTAVVKNYKKALKKKKSLRTKSAFRNPAYIAGGIVAALLLVYGVRATVQFQGNQKTQAVFNQQQISDSDLKQADTKANEQATDAGNQTGDGQAGDNQTEDGQTSNNQTGDNQTKDSQTKDAQANGQSGDQSAMAGSGSTTSIKNESGQQSTQQLSGQSGAASDGTGSTKDSQSVTSSSEEAQETWNSTGGYYTVKRGDTLAGISKKMYQSYNYIEVIAEANGIENVDEIYPGQILEIPQIED